MKYLYLHLKVISSPSKICIKKPIKTTKAATFVSGGNPKSMRYLIAGIVLSYLSVLASINHWSPTLFNLLAIWVGAALIALLLDYK